MVTYINDQIHPRIKISHYRESNASLFYGICLYLVRKYFNICLKFCRRRRSSASLSGSSSSSSSSRSRSPPKKQPKRTVSSPPRKTRRLSPSASPPRRRHRPSPPPSPPPKPRRSPTPQQSNRVRKTRLSVSPSRTSGKENLKFLHAFNGLLDH